TDPRVLALECSPLTRLACAPEAHDPAQESPAAVSPSARLLGARQPRLRAGAAPALRRRGAGSRLERIPLRGASVHPAHPGWLLRGRDVPWPVALRRTGHPDSNPQGVHALGDRHGGTAAALARGTVPLERGRPDVGRPA